MENENKNNRPDNNQDNFGLPEGYFKKSAGSILNKIEWEEEHRDYSNLVRLKGEAGFSVPENYFFKKEVQLEQLSLTKLSAIKKENGFLIPENYFEQTKQQLESNLEEGFETLPEYSLLNAIKKQNHFTVSENYFTENSQRLNELLKEKKPVKIIQLSLKRVSYALAALLLVVLGVWIYSFYFAPIEIKDCGTIACVDRIDLVKTKNLENLENDELYELVNPKDLEKKLESTKETKPAAKKDTNFKDVSTDDLLDEI